MNCFFREEYFYACIDLNEWESLAHKLDPQLSNAAKNQIEIIHNLVPLRFRVIQWQSFSLLTERCETFKISAQRWESHFKYYSSRTFVCIETFVVLQFLYFTFSSVMYVSF